VTRPCYVGIVGRASPSTLPAAALDGRTRSLEAAEHVATVLRMRATAGLGLLIWTASVAADVQVASNIAPGTLPRLLALRALGAALILAFWLRMRARRRPSPRELRFVSAVLFTSTPR